MLLLAAMPRPRIRVTLAMLNRALNVHRGPRLGQPRGPMGEPSAAWRRGKK